MIRTHPLQMKEYPLQYASTDKNKKSHYKAEKRNKSVSRDARALLFYGLKSRVAFFFSLYLFKKNKVDKNEKSRSEKKKKKKYPGKKLTGVSELLMKSNEHQFRSPVVSPQDYFDDIQRRSWETSDAWSNQLVHGPWQMNNLRGNCGLH